MSEMTATDARERFSEALAAANREPVFITRHGKRIAALVTAEFYERAIEALEDAEDVAAARAALANDEPAVPCEVVKAGLGLVRAIETSYARLPHAGYASSTARR